MNAAFALALSLTLGAQSNPGAPELASPAQLIRAVELHLPPGSDPEGLTELVGVRRGQVLSRRAIQRSIERVFATQRYADVIVYTQPIDGGVKVIFEIAPKRAITQLRVAGNQEEVMSDPQVLAAAKLSPGAEYYPERIDGAVEAITEAYHRMGYEQVTVAVDLHETTDGTEVDFFVEEGAPTRVAAITVAGSPGLPLERILSETNLAVGAVLSRSVLESGLERLRALYRREHYYRANLGEPLIESRDGRARVSLPISAGPQYAFHFHGNRSLPSGLLRAVLDYDGGEPLDTAVMRRLARRLESLYRFRGFRDAHVQPREVLSPDGSKAVLAFDVEEGRPLFVRERRFEGNVAVSDGELALLVDDVFRSMEIRPTGEVRMRDDPVDSEGSHSRAKSEARPEPHAVFVEAAYQRALEVIAAFYREKGYVRARAELAAVEIAERDRAATITLKIDEGPRAIVREVSYGGTPPGFDLRARTTAQRRDEQGRVPLSSGSPYRAGEVEAARMNLTRALGRAGYLFASVEAHTQLSADGTSAKVAFAVDPGPQVSVGQVIIQGLTRTDEGLVRANLRVVPGDVLDPERLFESQRSLIELGIFRKVGVKLLRPEEPEPVKDVIVELEERPRLEGEYAVGYYVVDGPRVLGDISYPNVFGQGLNVALRGKLNYVGLSLPALDPNVRAQSEAFNGLSGFEGFGGRVNLSLSQPRLYPLLPTKVGFRADLVGERVLRPSYRFTRFAAIAGLDWEIASWLNASLQAELENDQVRTLTDAALQATSRFDQELLRFPEGQFTLVTARPSLALDFRDDPVNPHRGLLLTGAAELTKDLYALQEYPLEDRPPKEVDVFTLKVSGALSVYIPIVPRVTLALSARGGRIFSLLEDDEFVTIPPKRFFLGGTLSMRGFREDAVIPEDRRAVFRQAREDCATLINRDLGCSADGRNLLAGRELYSEGGTLFTLGKAELRFPGFGGLDFGVFGEAGNLWLQTTDYDPWRLRYVVGAGIRYGTPIGPLALDFGFNVAPDLLLNESYFNNVNFSIGVF